MLRFAFGKCVAQKLRAATALWLSGTTRPVPEAVLSLPHCRQRFPKFTLPHCSVRITPYRAPVSIASVTNGTRERERDLPQACSSAASSSVETARPTSSRVVSIVTLGCRRAQWPERFKIARRVPISRLTVFGDAFSSIRFCWYRAISRASMSHTSFLPSSGRRCARLAFSINTERGASVAFFRSSHSSAATERIPNRSGDGVPPTLGACRPNNATQICPSPISHSISAGFHNG